MAHKDRAEYNSYMNEYMKARYKARRSEVVKRLGGKCAVCDTDHNLELDHCDPTSKIDSIAKLSSASKKIFEAEVKKCQLLCTSCHLKKSRTEGSLGDRVRETICKCGKVFSTTKQFAGHKRWCKV